MKMVVAIINEDCLNEVVNSLFERGISGVTISDTRGFGNLKLKKDYDFISLNKKVKLEIVVSNSEFKNLAIEIIKENAHQLEHGAGKIFVWEVSEVHRIRTGEVGEDALKTY